MPASSTVTKSARVSGHLGHIENRRSWGVREDAIDFVYELIGETRLRQECVTASIACALLVGLEHVGRHHEDRRRACRRLATDPTHELGNVDGPRHTQFGHDEIGRRGMRQGRVGRWWVTHTKPWMLR